MSERLRVLLLEPFHGGSHAAFAEALSNRVDADWTLLKLPARHWKWRMRGAAAYFASHPEVQRGRYDVVLATSYVALAELYGLAPRLTATPSVLYFHENQLAYPTRDAKERDHHYGMTQLVSARAASRVVFNSEHNRATFLAEGQAFLQRMPDAVPAGWMDAIAAKSEVIPVALDLPEVDLTTLESQPSRARGRPLVVWNHRWEHDKGPDVLARAARALDDSGRAFDLAVCGQRFARVPEAFETIERELSEHIVSWGSLERSAYERLLTSADIALSTARHEFFGVSILEAAHFGARPLAPNALAYPEVLDSDHLYPPGGVIEALSALIDRWHAGERLRGDRRHLSRKVGASAWGRYARLLNRVAGRSDATLDREIEPDSGNP